MLPALPFHPNLIFIGGIASIAAASAVGVVAFQNAVRSALSLVVNFFMLAVLYFSMDAEMIGITQVVVYTGAIMVLFLFVIMLLNLGAAPSLEERKDLKTPLGLLCGLGVFGAISGILLKNLQGVTAIKEATGYGSPENLGSALFTVYTWPFEVASILLVVGIVGSIILAKRRIS